MQNTLADRLAAPLTNDEMTEARRRIRGHAHRTPLIAHANDVYLKLEALQPFGSYKIRGATNVIGARMETAPHFDRIATASAGNFGLALASAALAAGKTITIHVPDNAARVKVDKLRAIGAEVREHGFADWWRVMQTGDTGDTGALFIHPVCEREVIAGAATIGVEILEELHTTDVLIAPLGGGGLITGVAEALKAVVPTCRIVAVECETAAPLTAAFAAGGPIAVDRKPSFIDGMGSSRVLDAMWPRLRRLVDETTIVSLDEVAEAVRTLARDHHVVAEGAGAAALAAATRFPGQRVVALISGGNIDLPVLARILQGHTPEG